MTRSLLLCVLLVLPTAAAAQDPPLVTSDQAFAWDYPDVDLQSAGVTRFETQIDGDVWTSVGLNPLPNSPESYYTPIPAGTPTEHTLSIRACNDQRCGDPTAPLRYRLGVDIPDIDRDSIRVVAMPPDPS